MGSSPISGTKNLENFAIICYNTYIARFASVAQLFRALPCQGRGRELESLHSHHFYNHCCLTIEDGKCVIHIRDKRQSSFDEALVV